MSIRHLWWSSGWWLHGAKAMFFYEIQKSFLGNWILDTFTHTCRKQREQLMMPDFCKKFKMRLVGVWQHHIFAETAIFGLKIAKQGRLSASTPRCITWDLTSRVATTLSAAPPIKREQTLSSFEGVGETLVCSLAHELPSSLFEVPVTLDNLPVHLLEFLRVLKFSQGNCKIVWILVNSHRYKFVPNWVQKLPDMFDVIHSGRIVSGVDTPFNWNTDDQRLFPPPIQHWHQCSTSCVLNSRKHSALLESSGPSSPQCEENLVPSCYINDQTSPTLSNIYLDDIKCCF